MHRLVPVLGLLGVLAPATARASGMYDVLNGTAYDLEFPADPPNSAGDLTFRWVPLCDDGSGDHEWTRSGGTSGIAPTCTLDEQIRCIDGTRPMYYLDKARLMNNTADLESDDWVFWFQGGGSCSEREGIGAGEVCWDFYTASTNGDELEMGSSDNLRRIQGTGILDPDRTENVFKTYNRVQIDKCSFDRFMGQAELLGTPNGEGDDIDLYWHGRRSIAAVIADLEDGATYRDGGIDVAMPPLDEAVNVLLVGHSGGAGGLIMNGDWIADTIGDLTQGADVRLLFDARFETSIENEPTFDTTYQLPEYDLDANGLYDIWDHIAPTVGNPGVLPGGGDYHRGAWKADGEIAINQDEWGVQLDGSCEAHFDSGDPRCRNEFHVLANHISTPFFVRQALRDQVHVDGRVDFAVDSAFRFTAAEFRERVLQQLDAFVQGHHTESIVANGDGGGVLTWPLGVFATDSATHNGVNVSSQFFDQQLCEAGTGAAAFSYHDALVHWMDGGEIIAIEDPAAFAGEYCDPTDPTCIC